MKSTKRQPLALKKLAEVLRRRRDGLRTLLNGEMAELRSTHGEVRDTIDEAVDDEHHDVCSQLATAETRELNEVENALRRLKLGTFGECESCNEAIPLARLQVLPYATRCVKCQRTSETHRGHRIARFDWPTNDDDAADNDQLLDNVSAEIGLHA